MNDTVQAIDTEPTQPSRADRADAATRMMEEARVADEAARAAREAARPPAPVGHSGASAFEPLSSRPEPRATPPAPAPAPTAPQQQAPEALTPRALAAQNMSAPQREVRAATTALEGAQRERQAADQELGRRLGRYGAGLTEQQIQQVTAAHRRENAQVYQGEQQAAERLSAALRQHEGALTAAARNPEGARTLARGLAALAQSSEAPAAVEMASRVIGAGGPAAANLRAEPNFERDVFERGIPTAAAIIAANNPNDPQAIGREVLRLTAPLGEMRENGSRVFQELANMSRGENNAFRNMVQRWDRMSSIERGLAGAGVVRQLATAAAGTAQGEPLAQQLQAWARAGQAGAEFAAGALGSMSTGARFAMLGGREAAPVLARMAPGLGLLANSLALANNVSQFRQTNNWGYAVAATGDAIATLGSAIGVFPPGAVPGAVVSAMGQTLSAGGELGAHLIADSRSRETQRRALQEAGLSHEAATAFLSAAPGVRALAQQGWSPQQIQQLAGSPNGRSLLGRPEELARATAEFTRLGASRDEALRALESFTGPELSALTAVFDPRRMGGQPQVRAQLQQLVERGGYSAEARAALARLLQYQR